MRDTDFDPSSHDSTDDGEDSPVSSFTVDDSTVLFDVDDAERWIKSDVAVDPASVA